MVLDEKTEPEGFMTNRCSTKRKDLKESPWVGMLRCRRLVDYCKAEASSHSWLASHLSSLLPKTNLHRPHWHLACILQVNNVTVTSATIPLFHHQNIHMQIQFFRASQEQFSSMRLSPGAGAAAPCSLLGVVPRFSKWHAKFFRVKHTEYIYYIIYSSRTGSYWADHCLISPGHKT